MSVDLVLNQGDDPECIRQFLSNREEGVLEPVADIPSKDIPEALGDNFTPNQIDEPSESDWNTAPKASAIKFFGGMADEERRRRGLFGDDEPEGAGENDGNVNDNVEQEVNFRFPIFDPTIDVTMKKSLHLLSHTFMVCPQKILIHFYLNSISYAIATTM